MNFVVVSSSSGEVSYTISYHANVPIVTSGVIEVEEDVPTLIPFNSGVPAMVICEVEKGSKHDQVAAAFSPYEINPFEEEPADFDEFWDSQKDLLTAVPVNPVLELMDENDYETTYELQLDNIDGRHVYGYISVPIGPGPFPAVLTLPPYGADADIVSPAETVAERGGAISVIISVHNTPPDEEDPNSYEPDDYTTKEGLYYRYSLLGAIRAIDYIFSRDDFDGESLAVNGVSQGGGLSTILAGLDDRVKLLVGSNGTMGQHSGIAYGRASGFPYYVKKATNADNDVPATVDATRYYDASFHARRFTGTSLLVIGYEDDICPPATGFAFYNQLRGPKILVHGLDLEHSHPPEYWSGRFNLYRRYFPAMQTPPWPWPDTEIGYAVDAGADQVVSGSCEVNLSAEVYLENELMNSYPSEWTQIEGPGIASFEDPSSFNTTVTFSEEGTYLLRFSAHDHNLIATENNYFTLADYVSITVNGNANTAPTVELSADDQTEGAFEVEIVFNQSVEGLEMSDFVIVNGTAVSLTGSGTTYTLTVNPTTAGNVEITLPAGSATECSNLGNIESNVLIVAYTLPSGVLDILCSEDLLFFVPVGTSELEVNWTVPSASTTCSVGSVDLIQIQGLPNGSDFPVGTSVITYAASDECGNLLSCDFQIMIEEEGILSDPDCYAQSNNPSNEYIKRVRFGSINNPSDESTYSDFTNQHTVLQKGGSTPFELTIQFTGTIHEDQYIKVWIDFNLDGSFEEATETVLSTSFEGNPNLDVFTIPALIHVPFDASEGLTRMRVAMKRDAYSDPCETFDYGEVEDYAVVINGTVTPSIKSYCPTDIYVCANPGSGFATVSWNTPIASTSCPNPVTIITQTAGPANGSLIALGITEISYDLIDNCGNTVECTFNVVVEPGSSTLTLYCPNDIEVTGPPGTIVNWGNPQAVSNCPIGSASITQVGGLPTGSLFPAGASNIVYAATDECGNVRSCNFTVSVTLAPESPDNKKDNIFNLTTAKKQVPIFPNPTVNKLNINLSAFAGESIEIEVINIIGSQQFYQWLDKAPTSMVINCNDLQQGMYMLRLIVKGQEEIMVERFVKSNL